MCPHRDIRFCPLYVAAHDGELSQLGCIAGEWAEGCRVDQGADYTHAVAVLDGKAPRFTAELRWRQMVVDRQEQRARNMRAAGVH